MLIKKVVEDKMKIERAHRTKSKSDKNNKSEQGKPKTIVANLHSYKDKIEILRNVSKLKNTNILKKEDFSMETLN